MLLSEAVRRAALFPELDLPAPPPEHPFERVDHEGYAIGVFRGASFGVVYANELASDAVECALEASREFLGTRGVKRGAWMVPEQAAPAGLAGMLQSMGLAPFDEPPLEPRFAAMAIITPPPAGADDVEARPARTFGEFQAGNRVADDAFDVSDDDRDAFEAQERLLWKLQSEGSPFRSFVALIDGHVVGSGGAIDGANAVYLTGGSTHADARGRGAYRALVRARWDAAVERGTPALTVGAGAMSRPILERLGFSIVGWTDCLLDVL